MPTGAVFKGGLELKFFEQMEFEDVDGVESSQQEAILARNILRFFTMGWTESWTQFLTPSVLYSFFVERNSNLLREVRFAMQQGFLVLFKQLHEKALTPEQGEQVQLYLSNCLCMLPYSDLTPYESFKIPQYIAGHWELVEYQVTPIELTATSGWRSLFIYDHDRVFAYGLEPLFQKNAESHLIFMGTTYPAGQGFLTQIRTDAKGVESVGSSLYQIGRERIHEWLSQQENTIHVCGVSLGGALSLLLAIDKGNYKLSRIDALNPPGLYDPLFKSGYDYWDELSEKPKVVIQKQGDDPVSAFGVWKKDWEILQVTPPKDKQGPNAFCDHCLNYAGFAETEFRYVAAEYDNRKRNTSYNLINALARTFVYYNFLVPYTYVFRPLGYFVLNKFFIREDNRTVENNSELAKIHRPTLLRNPTMDMYNTNNSIEMDLTYKQISTYYKVMRCLVKKKDYLSNQESESKHVQDMSKRTLLEKSLAHQGSDVVVSFKATKAKAAHIKHTLTLIHQIGFDNQEYLKRTLEKSYQSYCLGKQSS
ncbi:hypothetical protein Lgra_2504 [Legionella gratiana]|uniref:Lipase (Class 3) n=1 Tax=Legionella gratiana TaxID=45066 RepID=A0A378JEM8_9GAMM|nr:hypothetical protein [Legionella gratiana]KTD09269.1 hypothetical protein Lgra_2504 [Legionella gratiana]STX45478.1 Uncharacterised protein [Legionella gratiana]